jgi:hypothetical protein
MRTLHLISGLLFCTYILQELNSLELNYYSNIIFLTATAQGLYQAGKLECWNLIPERDKAFSVLHNVQTGSRAHKPSYPMGKGVTFPRSKVVVVLS